MTGIRGLTLTCWSQQCGASGVRARDIMAHATKLGKNAEAAAGERGVICVANYPSLVLLQTSDQVGFGTQENA